MRNDELRVENGQGHQSKVGSEIDICVELLTSSSSRSPAVAIRSMSCRGWTRRWVFSRRTFVENTTGNIRWYRSQAYDNECRDSGVQLREASVIPQSHAAARPDRDDLTWLLQRSTLRSFVPAGIIPPHHAQTDGNKRSLVVSAIAARLSYSSTTTSNNLCPTPYALPKP
jgi:hypothetical protein